MTNRRIPTGGLLLVSLTLVASTLAAESLAGETDSSRELLGLWAAKRDFTPEVRGTLSLRASEKALRAEVHGFSLPVSVDEAGVMRFRLTDGEGYFEGRKSPDGAEITGHWVQPRTFGGFARFASPVLLAREANDVWVGNIEPLQDPIHLFLVMRPAETSRSENPPGTGDVAAFIRNPEANLGRFYRIAKVERDETIVRFQDGQGRTRLEGKYDEERERLSIDFPLNGGIYDFTRVGDGDESPFYPRPSTERRYVYAPPVDGGGWKTASLDDVGLAKSPVENLVQMMIDTPMDAIDAPYIHALLVARYGKLVLEEYFHGYGADIPHGTRSAGKSVTTTLVGMAIQQELLDLEAPVYETMLGGDIPSDLDARAGRITLRHLITMTSGLDCDDSRQGSPGSEDVMQEQQAQPDWHRYTLALPMAHSPGTQAAYCSGGLNLAGGMVAKQSGLWLPEFYRRHFALPLGTGRYAMNLTPTGEGYGGGGIYLEPRDFLKLGQLYLDDGVWQGERLLPEGWVESATRAQARIGEEGYGYGWWWFAYTYQERELEAFYAGGNGGQVVIGIPELGLAIAAFAGNYNQRVMHQLKYEYVRDYILPAVEKSGSRPVGE